MRQQSQLKRGGETREENSTSRIVSKEGELSPRKQRQSLRGTKLWVRDRVK